MAHSLSAKKRMRQNAKRRAVNRALKGQVKSVLRAFRETAAAGDKPKTAEALRAAIKKVDQIAAKGTISKNTAARRKSLLQRQFNALSAK